MILVLDYSFRTINRIIKLTDGVGSFGQSTAISPF